MIKIQKGSLHDLVKKICPVDFEMVYFAEEGQLTFYLDEGINRESLNFLKANVMKYIGDNLLSDSYRKIKYYF